MQWVAWRMANEVFLLTLMIFCVTLVIIEFYTGENYIPLRDDEITGFEVRILNLFLLSIVASVDLES